MEQNAKLERGKVYRLPRGGYIFDTSQGYVQVGSPPETVKDSMYFEKGVPSIICLPKIFFSREKGISVAEVEFPIYYNFFLKKKKTRIICLKSQMNIFSQVIKEALFGPQKMDVSKDYVKGTSLDIPNMQKEIEHFVTFEFDNLVEFLPIDTDMPVILDSLAVIIDEKGDFKFLDKEYKLKLQVPSIIDYNVLYDIGTPSHEPYKPPKMGVTCLGPSHGFDPEDNTSGFILWLGGSGIMIDPPVNSTEWLLRSNVNPKLIDTIILTHTHADHDAGTLQKILEEDRITIYTTQTIMNSWLYKYSTLTQIPQGELASLFDFFPVLIGERINIKGAWFNFRYMLHSIPTVGFDLNFRGRSFVYSSDHLNSIEKFDELLKKKIISRKRHSEFLSFPWDSDVIYHESGFPPLHTPIGILNNLDKKIKEKTSIYHIAAVDFPKKTDLTLCKFGISDTNVIPVEESIFYQAYTIVENISRVDIFKELSVLKVRDLLSICETVNFKAGDHVIEKGKKDNNFYVILAGSMVLYKDKDKKEVAKRFGRFQYLGEVSLLTESPRTADVYAETDVEVISIEKNAFLNLIKGTETEKSLRYIVENRDMQSWQTISSTDFYDLLTSSQKTEMELLLERKEITNEAILNKHNQIQNELYFFHSGSAIMTTLDGKSKKLKMGDPLGNYEEFLNNQPSSIQFSVAASSLLFSISKSRFEKFLQNNPGIYIRFFKSTVDS